MVAVPGSPGGSLSYTVDGVAVATYDPTALADGAHTVTVTQTDAAGNVSPTTSLSFVLDRTAPSAPSLVLGSDTGASASDGVTRDATVVVAAGEPGGSLRYTVDGVAVTTYDPTALADGTHTVAVAQTDAAGNVSRHLAELRPRPDRAFSPGPCARVGHGRLGERRRPPGTRPWSWPPVSRAAACATRSMASRWRPTIRRRSQMVPITVAVTQTDAAGNVSRRPR